MFSENCHLRDCTHGHWASTTVREKLYFSTAKYVACAYLPISISFRTSGAHAGMPLVFCRYDLGKFCESSGDVMTNRHRVHGVGTGREVCGCGKKGVWTMPCVSKLWNMGEEFGEDAVIPVDFGPKETVRITSFANWKQVAF